MSPPKFDIFLIFPDFLRSGVLRQLVRQLKYQVCYTKYHVSFYLWLIGSVLKHCKNPKYYDQYCRCAVFLKHGIHRGWVPVSFAKFFSTFFWLFLLFAKQNDFRGWLVKAEAVDNGCSDASLFWRKFSKTAGNIHHERRIQNPVKYLRWRF